MKNTLEKLWNEYLFDECAEIHTDEERKRLREISELYDQANANLNKDQQIAVEKYVDAVCAMESLLTKKAFFKGCEFGVSFLLEARNVEG